MTITHPLRLPPPLLLRWNTPQTTPLTANPFLFVTTDNLCPLFSWPQALAASALLRGICPSLQRPVALVGPLAVSTLMAQIDESHALDRCDGYFALGCQSSSCTTSLPLVVPPRPAGSAHPVLRVRGDGSRVLVAPTTTVGLLLGPVKNIGRRFACAFYYHLRLRTSAMRVVPPYYAAAVNSSTLLMNPFMLWTVATPSGNTFSATI